MKKTNKKGFTLAELLVVVAIIAVLVAISIPIFTSQLEKSREATDAANIRAAIAEVTSEALTSENDIESKTVAATQKTAKWQMDGDAETTKISGMDIAAKVAGNSYTISYNKVNQKVEVK